MKLSAQILGMALIFKVPNAEGLAANMLTFFRTAYIYEQAFAQMKFFN
jgi:hypothetical protein